MEKIVECVPNISEGTHQEIIDEIADAICKIPGCALLDVDSGKSTNRTVYTFVGNPEAVVKAAIAAAVKAGELINMADHRGEHPRLGAMDVCPFVPVANVTMEECISLSKQFARQLADRLNVPVYLYEESSDKPHRKKLSQIRKGEYENLEKKLAKKEWIPDYGPAGFSPEWGATVTGARPFLIAYNVNLLGTSNQAYRIALNLREAGRGKNRPGLLKEVKAMGWYVDEYNMAQVTANLTNYNITAIHQFFEAVKKEARALNVGIAGSEIVGLIPLKALLDAADYYINKEKLLIIDTDQKITLARERLGLNSVVPFNPKEKIIDYRIRPPKGETLQEMSLEAFIKEVSSSSPAPGGGSVSAATAAMGAGLGAMAARLTYGKKKFDAVEGRIRTILPILHKTAMALIPYIDADTGAFKDYMEALKMPKITKDQQTARKKAMELGLKKAIEIPMAVMEIGNSAWDAMVELARCGNRASKSDMEVGAKALETGIWGAYKNVLINLSGINDDGYKTDTLERVDKAVNHSHKKCREVLSILSS